MSVIFKQNNKKKAKTKSGKETEIDDMEIS